MKNKKAMRQKANSLRKKRNARNQDDDDYWEKHGKSENDDELLQSKEHTSSISQ